ncbi:hypothetical protein P154DRAFT_576190 [Amniculicola lignicola CBS 123094]|uniref:RING-type domain-containing protein n=1 Tax=Amniculicola lignicola CBS 123094 TaxID=1392246 RepID=A0A6A5WRF9_9PLEO|nr:hypothetical protein P154DRAFT_576190 [Amniculicola lignicola CBS 123094]
MNNTPFRDQIEIISDPSTNPNTDTCPICQTPYAGPPAETQVRFRSQAPNSICRHTFGHQCLHTHLNSGHTWSHRCPICREEWLLASPTSVFDESAFAGDEHDFLRANEPWTLHLRRPGDSTLPSSISPSSIPSSSSRGWTPLVRETETDQQTDAAVVAEVARRAFTAAMEAMEQRPERNRSEGISITALEERRRRNRAEALSTLEGLGSVERTSEGTVHTPTVEEWLRRLHVIGEESRQNLFDAIERFHGDIIVADETVERRQPVSTSATFPVDFIPPTNVRQVPINPVTSHRVNGPTDVPDLDNAEVEAGPRTGRAGHNVWLPLLERTRRNATAGIDPDLALSSEPEHSAGIASTPLVAPIPPQQRRRVPIHDAPELVEIHDAPEVIAEPEPQVQPQILMLSLNPDRSVPGLSNWAVLHRAIGFLERTVAEVEVGDRDEVVRQSLGELELNIEMLWRRLEERRASEGSGTR